MERNQNGYDSILLAFFDDEELEELSIPQLRLLEALRFEQIPDEPVYLDRELRPRTPEVEPAKLQQSRTVPANTNTGSSERQGKIDQSRNRVGKTSRKNRRDRGKSKTAEQLRLLNS